MKVVKNSEIYFATRSLLFTQDQGNKQWSDYQPLNGGKMGQQRGQ